MTLIYFTQDARRFYSLMGIPLGSERVKYPYLKRYTTLVGQKSPHVVQMLKIEVKSHLRDPGNAEQNLVILSSLFFGHIKDRRNIYKLQNLSFYIKEM